MGARAAMFPAAGSASPGPAGRNIGLTTARVECARLSYRTRCECQPLLHPAPASIEGQQGGRRVLLVDVPQLEQRIDRVPSSDHRVLSRDWLPCRSREIKFWVCHICRWDAASMPTM